ncbi:MAG: sensor histidine kinase [Polyangiales bacterium]
MAAVVISFFATVVFAQWVLEPIEARSTALTANALPSIKHLVAARSALTRMESSLRANAASEAEVQSARRNLDAELAAYRALPQFPGEGELILEVDQAVALLDEHLGQGIDQPGLARFEAMLPFIERTDKAIGRLQMFNIDHGHDEATQIALSQQRSRTLATILTLTSLFTAVVASVLVLRLAKREERTAALHEELLVARATELEAFAGRIAHDLKNPLGALTMRLAVLQVRDRLAPEKLREHIDKAVRQVERMDHLIEGLLDFARGGANPPPGAHVQLRDVVDEVVAEQLPVAQAANTELRVDPFAPCEVACTPGALGRVLSNLLGNAVKYVAQGHKPVRQVLVHVKDRDQSVCIEVEDTGPGLPESSAERVFLPLVRLERTSTPSAGIGLATVKRIVEAFGGRVGVRSVLGAGSVFWFEIPKAMEHA